MQTAKSTCSSPLFLFCFAAHFSAAYNEPNRRSPTHSVDGWVMVCVYVRYIACVYGIGSVIIEEGNLFICVGMEYDSF